MKEESINPIQTCSQSVKVKNNYTFMTPQFLQIYKRVLNTSGLDCDHDLKWRNVLVYKEDHFHELYTTGNTKLPHLVLLHGYGGTSITYIKIFKHLKDHLQIHALDTFGVGLSSRGTWKDSMTSEEAKDYFVDAIEQWRKNVGLQTFILAGHSFGGFISTLYLEKYPERVNRLILLSPAGTARFTDQQIKERASKAGFFFCLAETLWGWKIRPSKVVNVCCIGNKVINFLLENRLKIPEQERDCWKDYLKYVGDQQQCSQTGFYLLFDYPLQPARSIEMIVADLKPQISVTFLYGDEDWMQPAGAHRLEKEFKNIKVHIVKKAGHQMIFDNPEEVSRIMKQACDMSQ